VSPDQLRALQITASGLIAGPLLFFAVGAGLRSSTGRPFADVPQAAWAAILVAIVSPILAGAVRSRLTGADTAGASPSPEKARAALTVYLGILEAAAFFCGIGFLLSPTWWPLLAGAIPLGAMIAAFPRAGSDGP
jgi:hypothetical protein